VRNRAILCFGMEDHAGEIASVFRRFDFDKDGSIRRDELARVLRSLDPGSFSDGAVDALLASADKNGDGTIDYEEFAIWVTEDPGHNVMSRSNKLDHAFLTHAKRFEWAAVFELLEARPDLINCHIAGRWSVLHQAARCGDCDIVIELLDRRANCSLTTRDGQTPMQVAKNAEIRERLGEAMKSAEHTSNESVQALLKHTDSLVKKSLPGLTERSVRLAEEVRAMSPAERTESAGLAWRVRGRRRDTWYDFKPEDFDVLETAYQTWVAGGSSKRHEDCRFSMQIHIGNGKTADVSIDFVLMTQRNVGRRGLRSIKRFVLPSRAREICDEYFDHFTCFVGDVCEKLQQVEFSKKALGLSKEASQDITRRKLACIDAMKAAVGSFLELAILCNADDLTGKLSAVLGEEYANRLAVASYVKEMHLRSVCKEVEKALKPRGGHGLAPWDRVRVLAFCGIFGDKPMLRMRESVVKTRKDKEIVNRRHAFMVAGSFLRETEHDAPLQKQGRDQLQEILDKALQENMIGGGDMPVIKELLNTAEGWGIGVFSGQVMDWLQERFASALRSNQPIQWVAELLQQVRDLPPSIDEGALAAPLLPRIVPKCVQGIVAGTLPPEDVNQMTIFRLVLGADFDAAIFKELESLYEDDSVKITEWLVAYSEHTGVELPGWMMTADQKEAFNNLESAIASSDPGQLKAACIAAKTVPDLKDNAELGELFKKALDILRSKSHLPPGWDIEDLLGTEKMYKKEPITDAGLLGLFQELMVSTHLKRWTRDRAMRGDGEAIADSFQVSRVTEVQNGSSWENYDRRRREIVAACTPKSGEHFAPIGKAQWEAWSGVIMTEGIGHRIATACKLSPLEQKCNEFLFFHGANPKVADLIAENHFDISFASKDGLFGAGLYFAEASSKSDEYVSPNEHDEFPLLLVRVILGRPNYVATQKPWENPGRRVLEHECMSGTYHSVIGDRIKTSGTYREMVVYDHFQAYPHFIVWYRRV